MISQSMYEYSIPSLVKIMLVRYQTPCSFKIMEVSKYLFIHLSMAKIYIVQLAVCQVIC